MSREALAAGVRSPIRRRPEYNGRPGARRWGWKRAGLPPRYLFIDHDSKYTKEFDAVFAAEGGPRFSGSGRGPRT